MNYHVPKHVAIIMDGNGRWGQARGLSRSEGHYAGVQAIEKVIDAGIVVGIEALTLYAFSTENWARSKDEVNYLMYLPIKFFNQKLPEFMRRNIKINVSGNLEHVPRMTQRAIVKAVEKTKRNTGLIVNFAFNYGGRDDMIQAIRKIAQEVKQGDCQLQQVDERKIDHALYTNGLPELDLLIRTGGEKRISNFLLWQAAYAELYFSDLYFPDFDEGAFREAVLEWQRRTEIMDIVESI